MGKTLSVLSDRMLGLFVPKAQAQAQAPCTEASWCQFCFHQGSMPYYQHCVIAGSCSVITCGQCMINNPAC